MQYRGELPLFLLFRLKKTQKMPEKSANCGLFGQIVAEAVGFEPTSP